MICSRAFRNRFCRRTGGGPSIFTISSSIRSLDLKQHRRSDLRLLIAYLEKLQPPAEDQGEDVIKFGINTYVYPKA